MEHALIEGRTRTCGKSQGFHGLHVRDDLVEDTVMGLASRITTAWRPTPEELDRLNKGACIHVMNVFQHRPGMIPSPVPMWVEIGEVPGEATGEVVDTRGSGDDARGSD